MDCSWRISGDGDHKNHKMSEGPPFFELFMVLMFPVGLFIFGFCCCIVSEWYERRIIKYVARFHLNKYNPIGFVPSAIPWKGNVHPNFLFEPVVLGLVTMNTWINERDYGLAVLLTQNDRLYRSVCRLLRKHDVPYVSDVAGLYKTNSGCGGDKFELRGCALDGELNLVSGQYKHWGTVGFERIVCYRIEVDPLWCNEEEYDRMWDLLGIAG